MVIENLGLVYSEVGSYTINPALLSYKDDMISEGIYALCLAAKNYDTQHDSEAKFSTYAYTCVRRRYANYVKHYQRHISRDTSGYDAAYAISDGNDEDSPSKIDMISETDINLEDMPDYIDMRRIIEMVFPRLSKTEQTIFQLFFNEGKSHTQIMEETGLSLKTISDAKYRVVSKMKQTLYGEKKTKKPKDVQRYCGSGKYYINQKGEYQNVSQISRKKKG